MVASINSGEAGPVRRTKRRCLAEVTLTTIVSFGRGQRGTQVRISSPRQAVIGVGISVGTAVGGMTWTGGTTTTGSLGGGWEMTGGGATTGGGGTITGVGTRVVGVSTAGTTGVPG